MLETATMPKTTTTDPITRSSEASETSAENSRRLVDTIRTKNLRFVDLWFTEMRGRSWRISIRADLVDQRFLSSVVTLDGRTVGGAWDGFIVLRPDPTAFFVDPVASVPSLALICDVVSAAQEDYPLDPRRVLKRAEAYLRQSGIASSCAVGAEPEFFLLDGDRPVPDDALREFLREMAAALSDAGMQIDWFRVGPAPGKGRVQMRATNALRTADQVVIYKHVAKRLARKEKKSVFFLPKPILSEDSAGMPLHHSLWQDGVNLFHDPNGWALTSDAGRHYAGGLLRHAPALLAFCAPTMNSFRRLVPGFFAPTELVLSKHRWAAACRIPANSTGPSAGGRRVKFCCADSSSNPYLALAATLMAGLDGIENKIEPPLEHAEGPDAMHLPNSLEEALAALGKDHAFLGKGGVFTEEIIKTWTEETWRLQILPVRARPHPWELHIEEER